MQKCLIYGKGGRHLGKPRQIWNSSNRRGEGGGPPDPDFDHVNENSRFWGRGGEGSRTAPIGDPDFIFVSLNGQLGSVRGS